jgi:hypothetical protein
MRNELQIYLNARTRKQKVLLSIAILEQLVDFAEEVDAPDVLVWTILAHAGLTNLSDSEVIYYLEEILPSA